MTLLLAVLMTATTACGIGPAGGGGEQQRALPDIVGMEPRPLSEPTTLRINMASRLEAFSNTLLAVALGEFKKENIDVEIVELPSTDAIGLLAQGDGKIDLMLASFPAAAFNAVAAGANIAAIYPGYAAGGGDSASVRDGIWIRKEAIENPELLRGAVFGSASGVGGYVPYFLNKYLDKFGLKITDVEIRRFPATEMPLAIEQGVVMGAYVTCPTCDEVNTDIAEFVIPAEPALSMNIAGPRLLNNPEIALAVVRAIARTHVNYLQGNYKENPEVVKALAGIMQVSEDYIRSTPPYKFSTDLALPPPEAVHEAQQQWVELGGVLNAPEPIPYEKMFRTEFVNQVVNAQK